MSAQFSCGEFQICFRTPDGGFEVIAHAASLKDAGIIAREHPGSQVVFRTNRFVLGPRP